MKGEVCIDAAIKSFRAMMRREEFWSPALEMEIEKTKSEGFSAVLDRLGDGPLYWQISALSWLDEAENLNSQGFHVPAIQRIGNAHACIAHSMGNEAARAMLRCGANNANAMMSHRRAMMIAEGRRCLADLDPTTIKNHGREWLARNKIIPHLNKKMADQPDWKIPTAKRMAENWSELWKGFR